jgi:flagellar biosynthesis protein FlhB
MPPRIDAADGRGAEILARLLCFLAGAFPRSPAVEQAVVHLVVILVLAYFAGHIVERCAGVLLPSTRLAAPAASSEYLGRLLTLVSAWLLVFAALLTAFVFLGAGMGGIELELGWNVLS